MKRDARDWRESIQLPYDRITLHPLGEREMVSIRLRYINFVHEFNGQWPLHKEHDLHDPLGTIEAREKSEILNTSQWDNPTILKGK